MSAPYEFIQLLGGVLCVLVLASVLATILKKRVGPEETNPVIENLVARINAWWAMVALLAIAMPPAMNTAYTRKR